jgi:hypothetical protein
MPKKAAFLTLVLLLSATSLLAEVTFGISLGIRDQDDHDGSYGTFGLTGAFGGNSWIVRPEVGFFTAIDPLDNDREIEKSAGLVHSWRKPRVRFDLGAGFTSVPSERSDIDESAKGGYVHGAIEYTRQEGSAFGLDLRYVQADDIEAEGERISVDSIQIAFTIRWHLKGPKAQ